MREEGEGVVTVQEEIFALIRHLQGDHQIAFQLKDQTNLEVEEERI